MTNRSSLASKLGTPLLSTKSCIDEHSFCLNPTKCDFAHFLRSHCEIYHDDLYLFRYDLFITPMLIYIFMFGIGRLDCRLGDDRHLYSRLALITPYHLLPLLRRDIS